MTDHVWKMQRIGLSSDMRTSRWKITPPCGHRSFVPNTTMLAGQFVKCPRCGIEALANYNDETFQVSE